MTHDIPARTSESHLANYDGLATGHVLEIGSGTPSVEVIVIRRFGSIHLVSATRHANPRESAIRRLVEGTGPRYQSARRGHTQGQGFNYIKKIDFSIKIVW